MKVLWTKFALDSLRQNPDKMIQNNDDGSTLNEPSA